MSNSIKLDYQRYLQSDYWKEKRVEVLKKQGSQCRVCDSTKKIQIHHRRYNSFGKSILFREKNSQLLPLCGDCHSLWHKLHGYKRIPFARLKRYFTKGVDKQELFAHPYKRW